MLEGHYVLYLYIAWTDDMLYKNKELLTKIKKYFCNYDELKNITINEIIDLSISIKCKNVEKIKDSIKRAFVEYLENDLNLDNLANFFRKDKKKLGFIGRGEHFHVGYDMSKFDIDDLIKLDLESLKNVVTHLGIDSSNFKKITSETYYNDDRNDPFYASY